MRTSIAGLAQMHESKAVAMSDGSLDEFFSPLLLPGAQS
jgi:hypothetical protein